MSISLGSITFGLGPDTTRLKTAISDIQAFGRAVSNAARSTAEGARANEAALRRQEQATINALMRVQNFQDKLGSINAPIGLGRTTQALNSMTKQMTSGRLSALEFQRVQEKFGVTMNNAERQLRSYSAAEKLQQKIDREFVTLTRQADAALLKREATLFRATQAVEKYNNAVVRSNAPARLTQGPQLALGTLQSSLTPGASPIAQQRATQAFTTAMTAANHELALFNKGRAGVDSITAALQKASAASILLAGPLSGISARIAVLAHVADQFSLAWAGALAGIAGGVFAFYKLGAAAITTAKQLQQIEQTLTAVSGSQVVAQAEMSYLTGVAQRSGQQLTTIAKQYSQLEAAAQGTNLEGQRTRDIFEAIVFAGAKLGLSNQAVEGTLRAIQQIMSKGTIQAEELRNQLGDQLPGAMRLMAAALGVTTAELNNMLKKGQVTSSSLVQFGEQIKKSLGIDTSKNVDTLVASENRLVTSLTLVNDAIDKTVGFSTAYRKVLDGISALLVGVAGDMRSLVSALGAVVGGLTVAFGNVILNSIFVFSRAIVGATAAVVGLNAAILSNPLGTLALVIARIIGAIAGGVIGFKLMEQAISGVGKSYLQVLPGMDAYIAAQQKQLTLTKNITQEYLKQAQAQQVVLYGQIADAEGQLAALKQRALGASLWGNTSAGDVAVAAFKKQIDSAEASIDSMRATADRGEKSIVKLKEIMNKQDYAEKHPAADVVKAFTNSQQVALKNAGDTIRELQEKYNTLYAAPAQRQFLHTQLEINKQVENFRDRLTRSLGGKDTQLVTDLTERYAAALTKVKMAELDLANHVSYFQLVEGVFSRGLDTAVDNFVDGIMEGKDAMEILKDTWKAVLADMWKSALQFAVTNPIKNFLFGTNYQTLGGNAGIGGFLGSLLGGGGGATASIGRVAAFSAGGGIVGPYGRIPINRYRGGGVAHGPQMSIFGEGDTPEAYVPVPNGRIPVEGNFGGNNKQIVNIYPPKDTKTESKDRSEGGAQMKDIVISWVNEGISNGRISKSLTSKFVMPKRQEQH